MNTNPSAPDSSQAESPQAGLSHLQKDACESALRQDPISADARNVDSDLLFRLLTEEIRDRHELGKLEGWTPWLITGALVSVVWLLVQDAWGNALRPESVRASFLVASITLFAVLDIRGTLLRMSETTGNRRPFSLLHTSTTALNAAAKSLWFTVIGLACIFRPRVVDSFAVFVFGMCFLVFASVGLLMVFLIAKRLPIPISRPTVRVLVVLTAAFTTLGVTSVVALAKSNAISVAQVADIRAGGLLALGAFGIVILCRGHSSSSVAKETLVELRQEIVLGSLSSEDALQRTRVALQGMFSSDLIRDDARELLKLISEVRGVHSGAFQTIGTLKAGCPSLLSSTVPADFEKLAIAGTLDLLQTCEPKVNEISKRYFALLKSVRLRIALISRIMKAASSDEANLLSEIKRAQARADADLKRFVQEYHEIQSAWNRLYPTESRHYKPFGESASERG